MSGLLKMEAVVETSRCNRTAKGYTESRGDGVVVKRGVLMVLSTGPGFRS